MPLYDYHCIKCGKKFERYSSVENRHNVKCECGERADKLMSMSAKTEIFEPMWYNDICEEPIYVTSKGQLREECKRHDVIAARLL